MYVWLPVIEGHATLYELDSYWTMVDLRDYHKATSIKRRISGGMLSTIANAFRGIQ